VPDLADLVHRHVAEILQMLVARVVRRNAEELGVRPLRVMHPEHGDEPRVDQAAGEGGFAEQHQCVDGVAVLGQGVRDEPVVARVAGRGEEHPVQPDPAHLWVELVLVAPPLGNLDDHVDGHGRDPLGGRANPSPAG
jgi:hypothetical protein